MQSSERIDSVIDNHSDSQHVCGTIRIASCERSEPWSTLGRACFISSLGLKCERKMKSRSVNEKRVSGAKC